MNRLCLDTSAYSNFQRGHRQTVDCIDGADWIGLPNVVRGELWAGFLLGNRVERNAQALALFLEHAAVEILDVDSNVARIYGEIFVELRRKGNSPANQRHLDRSNRCSCRCHRIDIRCALPRNRPSRGAAA